MRPKKGKRGVPPNSVAILKQIKNILCLIYSRDDAEKLLRHLKNKMDVYSREETIRRRRKLYRGKPVLNERDSIVITYADNIRVRGKNPS